MVSSCLILLFFWQFIRNSVRGYTSISTLSAAEEFSVFCSLNACKIEYISFSLYHVENLWFMVCWNSSCYIQNASPGSSNNAQGLSTLNSQCFSFQFLSFTFYLEIFCFNLLFVFSLAKLFCCCLWKVLFFQAVFCVILYGYVSRCSSAFASSY